MMISQKESEKNKLLVTKKEKNWSTIALTKAKERAVFPTLKDHGE